MEETLEVFMSEGTKQLPTNQQTHLQRPRRAPEKWLCNNCHEPGHLANEGLGLAGKR